MLVWEEMMRGRERGRAWEDGRRAGRHSSIKTHAVDKAGRAIARLKPGRVDACVVTSSTGWSRNQQSDGSAENWDAFPDGW